MRLKAFILLVASIVIGSTAATSDTLESLLDSGQFEPVTEYMGNPVVEGVVQHIGFLDILLSDGRGSVCTAILIASDQVLTTAHCVKTKSAHAVSAYFTLGYHTVNVGAETQRYAVKPQPIEIGDAGSRDYAVLALMDPVPSFQKLDLVPRSPTKNEPLILMGHQDGGPLILSRGGCRSEETEVPHPTNHFAHTCASLAGASGSILVSSDLRFWIGMHIGSGDDTKFAVSIEEILANSPTPKLALQ